MPSNRASTVSEYLASVPAERRTDLEKVLRVVRKNVPQGYEEGILYGMIGWYIPLTRYPTTYNGQPLAIVSLAAQKSHLALYMMGVYADAELAKSFQTAYAKSGKKLDMGKSCLRFRTADDLALDVVGAAIAKVAPDRFIHLYEASRSKPATKKTSAKKTAAKKTSAKKTAAKQASPKR